MKILQITNSLHTGGAEKLLIESVPLANAKNIEMDIALLSGVKTPFLNKILKLDCCKVFFLGKDNVYNPFLVFKIIPLLRKYDLIHVHLFPSLYWVAFAKMISFSRTKLVYTEHSTSNRRRSSLLFKILDKFIYARYAKIITIAPEVDDNIKKHLNTKKDTFYLIQNGINLKAIEDEERISKSDLIPNIGNTTTIVLQVASFRYPKDQKTVIKSLKLLDDNIILALVGDGPLKQECEDLVTELELTDRVFFLGIRMDVISVLKSVDIVVLSSHHEGLSLSSIEGMASGKPFIASDVPGLGDVVRGAGKLFPKNDETTLANEIKKLVSDETYYNETVNNCLQRASQYDINHTINKQITLYKSLL